MELYYNLGILAGIVFSIYIVYRIVRLTIPKISIFLLKENGKYRQEAFCKYDSAEGCYKAYDLTIPFAGKVGELVAVEDKAWLRLKQEDADADALGYIDLSGNIFDKENCLIGYIGNAQGQPDMKGRRKWYEFFLRSHAYIYAYEPQLEQQESEEEIISRKSECIGKCIETGRFRKKKSGVHTGLGYAAAFLLLYQREREPEVESGDVTHRYSWTDTAFVSSFVFAAIYTLFYLFNADRIRMPFLDDLSFFAGTMLVFGCIWVLIRRVKIEQSLNGKPAEALLMLFNRNTGLVKMNMLIIILTVIALLISLALTGRDFVPVQLAILIGILVNNKFITKRTWVVQDKFRLSDPKEMEEESVEGKIIRSYTWELDSDENTLHGRLDLHFTNEEIVELRQRNPFRSREFQEFDCNLELLFRETINGQHIRRINNYITRIAREADLSAFETMQFTLDFVHEPNISDLTDFDTSEAEKADSVRFPVETLYDKRGDYISKAVLAAALFRNAGYKVAYVASEKHVAIAVACPKKWFSGYNMDLVYSPERQAIIGMDGQIYYFCETINNAPCIGDYSESRPEDFNNIRYLI